jgi:spermidine synthase
MLPWVTLDEAEVPGGSKLTLCRRGNEFVIRIDGQELMGSRNFESERRLAESGCAGLAKVAGARVLCGGLGMGYTARAALDALAADAILDVAELVPAVVTWNRNILGEFARHPLADRRTNVIERDVVRVLAEAERRYDAILLDVDNGPSAMTVASNSKLYDDAGVQRVARALRPGGMFAVWSAAHDARDSSFETRLRRFGFDVRTETVTASKQGGKRHMLWLARHAPRQKQTNSR